MYYTEVCVQSAWFFSLLAMFLRYLDIKQIKLEMRMKILLQQVPVDCFYNEGKVIIGPFYSIICILYTNKYVKCSCSTICIICVPDLTQIMLLYNAKAQRRV